MNSARPMRVLLVGPLPRAGEPIGGTQVSFGELVRGLKARGILEVEVLDTSRDVLRARGWHHRIDGLRVFSRTLQASRELLPRCDLMMFNASSGAMLRAGPCFAALARWHGKPFVARCFGGNLDLALERAGPVERRLAKTMFERADLVLLQTQALCDALAATARVRWLPTTRSPGEHALPRSGPARSFLYLSQMRPEKGFEEALTAIESLPEDVSLTLHGPLMPGTERRHLEQRTRARWLGPLASERVPEVLAAHDAFVFPSYYAGEGLPGAVIEALQAGLPVVAADWRSIRELIVPEENGLLVPPRDARALAQAMRRLCEDATLARRLSTGALRTGRKFQARPMLAQLESWIDALARERALDAAASIAPARPSSTKVQR